MTWMPDPDVSASPPSQGPDGVSAEQWGVLRSGLEIMIRRAVGDRAAVEDLVQETLTRAVVALRANRVEQRGRLGAFVAGIARHVIADAHREWSRLTSLGPDLADPHDPVDALALVISEAEHDRVRRALANLGQADRELLRLSFFTGLAPAEIARRTGEPATRIRKRKSRALDRLRQALLASGQLESRSAARSDKPAYQVPIDE